jgi:hypothetical protein
MPSGSCCRSCQTRLPCSPGLLRSQSCRSPAGQVVGHNYFNTFLRHLLTLIGTKKPHRSYGFAYVSWCHSTPKSTRSYNVKIIISDYLAPRSEPTKKITARRITWFQSGNLGSRIRLLVYVWLKYKARALVQGNGLRSWGGKPPDLGHSVFLGTKVVGRTFLQFAFERYDFSRPTNHSTPIKSTVKRKKGFVRRLWLRPTPSA